jgi:hypothetical protein
MNRIASGLVLCTLLIGCGDDDDNSAAIEASSTPAGGEVKAFDGVWDDTSDSEDGQDISYSVVSGNSYTSYDYMGDSFDEGDDCYEVSNATLEALGGTDYQLDFSDSGFEISVEVQFIRDGNKLSVTTEFGTSISTLSNKTEDDFSPICD